MIDPFVLLAPVLLLAVIALLRFVGCDGVFGIGLVTAQTETPTFDPLPGTFSAAQTVTLQDATQGATIYYTTDGSIPTIPPSGTTQTYSVSITVSTTTRINAIAQAPDSNPSGVASAQYTIISAAIGFVQVNAGTPPTPPNVQSVSVPYPNPQKGGNLNIVVVGWNDATSDVLSVMDSNNNSYVRAIGPKRGTNLSQSIYYAPNIAADMPPSPNNKVTVNFSQAVPFPDVRVLEYTGLSAPDGPGAEASGSGTATSCGPVTTSVANELIFAANTVATHTNAGDSSFTQRIITTPDGDLAEDRIVSAIETRSASDQLDPLTAGPWVMQMVAFK